MNPFENRGTFEVMLRPGNPLLQHRGTSYLIVDDYPRRAEVLGRWLKRSGSEVRTASDGLPALQTAEEFGPDVMFLDIDMPKLSGIEVAHKIRQQRWAKTLL